MGVPIDLFKYLSISHYKGYSAVSFLQRLGLEGKPGIPFPPACFHSQSTLIIIVSTLKETCINPPDVIVLSMTSNCMGYKVQEVKYWYLKAAQLPGRRYSASHGATWSLVTG